MTSPVVANSLIPLSLLFSSTFRTATNGLAILVAVRRRQGTPMFHSRPSLVRGLILVAACSLLHQPELSAQSSASSHVYDGACQVFKARGNDVTAKGAKKIEWFPGSLGFPKGDGGSFAVVPDATDVPVGDGPRFSLAGSAAQQGDVVRIDWTHKDKPTSLHLVYAGEEKFPGADATHSFFIYPYRSRLEYNTMPGASTGNT